MSIRIMMCAFLTLSLFFVFGCSKKAAKVSAQPNQAQSPVRVEPPPSAIDDNSSFIGQEMDAKTRDLLIPLYFAFNRSDLTNESIWQLEKIGPLLSENLSMALVAEGHCDERGSSEYNIGLGENRARAVKRWLTSYGVQSSRVDITSYGKERPTYPNCADDDCHARNRRVEWKVVSR
jgi:peptidoglycan-associated lipoprotein